MDAVVDQSFTQIKIPPGAGYRGREYQIEPDASNASYFLAAAAIIPGSRCTIEGLGKGSVQGDVGFADVLQQMGAGLLFGKDFITVIGPPEPPEGEPLRGIDIDLNDMPDMAQTLAVVALFAHGPTVIRNVGNLRVKETDRLAALQTEFTKLGATAHIDGDDLHIQPPPENKITPPSGRIDTYNDHRMAMSFAVAGLHMPGIVINDPKCVGKTFPEYFEYLARLGRGVARQQVIHPMALSPFWKTTPMIWGYKRPPGARGGRAVHLNRLFCRRPWAAYVCHPGGFLSHPSSLNELCRAWADAHLVPKPGTGEIPLWVLRLAGVAPTAPRFCDQHRRAAAIRSISRVHAGHGGDRGALGDRQQRAIHP